MPRPTTYSTDAGLAVARLVAEGRSLRSIAGAIPRHQPQISKWRADHEEFARLLRLATFVKLVRADEVAGASVPVAQLEAAERAERALYAPLGDREALLGEALEYATGPNEADDLMMDGFAELIASIEAKRRAG